METDALHAQERTARETHHDAMFVIRDGHGADHFWSIYHQAVVVIEDSETATVDLPVTQNGQRIDSLGDWLEYTRSERGVEHHRVSTGLVDDLQRSVRA